LFRLAGEVDKDAGALGHKDSEAWRISQAAMTNRAVRGSGPSVSRKDDLLRNLTLSAILPVLGS
jgi:hypothetical protein